MINADTSGWISYHIFYHGDRNLILRNLVGRILPELWRSRIIESFFFIRYSLGGPHVRLRFAATTGNMDILQQKLQEQTEKFFEQWPSEKSIAQEILEADNAVIIQNDPGAQDLLFPDNSALLAPLEFEIERYGGTTLLPYSLEYFAISSLSSLLFNKAHGSKSTSQQLPLIFRKLAGISFAFSNSECEFLDCADYFSGWREAFEPIIVRAESVFERQADSLCELLRREAYSVRRSLETGEDCEIQGARRLMMEISSSDPETRRRIYFSHLHMTANRLGLKNKEEMYLTHLLYKAAKRLSKEGFDLSTNSSTTIVTKELHRIREELFESYAATIRE
jgi:hypothetical protein